MATNGQGNGRRRPESSKRKIAALVEIARAVAQGGELADVLTAVTSTMARVLDFPWCTIYEYREEQGDFRVLADYWGEPEFQAEDWKGRTLGPREMSCALRAFAADTPVVAHPDDPALSEAERDLMRSFGETVLVSLPMTFAGRKVGAIEFSDVASGRVVTQEDLSLAQTMADQAVAAIMHAKSVEELRAVHLGSLFTLAAALNAKDAYTHGHAARVAAYAVMLCREVGIDAALTAELEKACYLHDIGKIGITDRILQKHGRLNPEERSLMENHAEMSADIISPLFSGDVLAAVRHHHENWDGTGYPDGLQQERIPLLARVMHLADSYDAMSYSRPYAKALRYGDAVREIQDGAGREFDPALVLPFVTVLERIRGIRERAARIARDAAAQIDADQHAWLVAPYQEDSDIYRDMVAKLRAVRDANPGVRFITTVVLRRDCARIILDTEEDEALRSHIGDPYPYEYDSPLLSTMWLDRVDRRDLVQLWFDGEENVLYFDQWGVWLSGAAPIRNDRGEVVAVVNVDIPALAVDHHDDGARRVFNALLADSDLLVKTRHVLAITDELTGLYNHRAFQDQLAIEVERADLESRPLSLLIIDIDDFTVVNERLGHAQGDRLLHAIAQALVDGVPAQSACARYGGEELAVVMPDADADDAAAVADALLEALPAAVDQTVTVSIGVANYPAHAEGRLALLRAAESALERAKRLGKGRVVVAAPE